MRLYEVEKPREDTLDQSSPRAGLVPYFHSTEGLMIYLMKPSDVKYGGPKKQIAKGGIDDGESPLEGAMREAKEELGLKDENIRKVEELLITHELTLTDQYKLTVFVGEIINPDDWGEPHYETGWSGWVHIDVAIEHGRYNHREYFEEIKEKYEIQKRKFGLREEQENPSNILYTKWMQKIKQDCQPYLSQLSDPVQTPLYRGLRTPDGADESFGIKTARLADRNPRDSTLEDHQAINDYLQQKHSHPYRNGVFASGNYGSTMEYAEGYASQPYIIFPIGDFDFIWSENIKDLFEYVTNDGYSANDNWIEYAATLGITTTATTLGKQRDFVLEFRRDHSPAELIEYLGGYQSKNLEEGIKSGHEVMLWCKSYYYVDRIAVKTKEIY